MKISKQSVTAATPTEELNSMVYEDAIKSIKTAINQLGALARRTDDVKAKEAIANLGVVLLELQD